MNNNETLSMIGKNTNKLIEATERFNQLVTFLAEERGLNSFKMKIGTFQYDDWKHFLYIIMNRDKTTGTLDIHFKELDENKNQCGKYNKLTDLCFGWDFAYAKINIFFELYDNYYNILSLKEKDIFEEIYYDVHSHFW